MMLGHFKIMRQTAFRIQSVESFGLFHLLKRGPTVCLCVTCFLWRRRMLPMDSGFSSRATEVDTWLQRNTSAAALAAQSWTHNNHKTELYLLLTCI